MNSKQFIVLFLTLITLWGCEGNLDVEKLDNVVHPGFPEYNFSYRFLGADSLVVKNDTIEKGKISFVELYVNQLDFSKTTVAYTFGFSLPANVDASLKYKGVEYRMGDKLTVPYADFKDKVIRVKYLPITSGTYSLVLTAIDDGNNERSLSKKINVK